MHADSAYAIAESRFAGTDFDNLMLKLGFDCAPFSSKVEYSEYKYDKQTKDEN